MKKVIEKLLAMLLITATLFSIAAQSISASVTEETETVQTFDQPTPRAAGAAVGSAVAKYLLGRAYQEISSYAISNDVPIIGGVAKLMLNPSQRAALKQSAQVTEILNTVNDIQSGISHIQTQLTEIKNQINSLGEEIKKLQQQTELLSWQIEALNQKLDQQQALNELNQIAANMNSVSIQYTAAWNNYQAFVTATETLGEKQGAREKATDETEIARLDAEIAATDVKVQDTLNAFINVISEGGGKAFASDIGALEVYIYNPDNPGDSYLGAYENYLRMIYPFEHQITEEMSSAMISCTDMLRHIFAMYQEYYSYMKEYTDKENEGDPTAKNPYKTYTDSYFQSEHDKLEEYIVSMAEDSGVAEFMIPEKLSASKLEECRKLDPNFVEPENINTSIDINGTAYQCYKVRSNSDFNYYLILKSIVAKDKLVQTTTSNYFTSSNVTVCRPGFVLDNEYTDDGCYRLISSSELPAFITDATSNVLSYLRLDGNLALLPQDTQNIILRDNSCSGVSGSDVVWNIKAVNTSEWGKASTVNIGTADIKNGKAGNHSIAVYKLVNTGDEYDNSSKTYQVTDKYLIEDKVVAVDNGQTLDLTKISVNLNNVTINVIGSGTIKSNSKITLENSRINIFNGSAVMIEDLNIKAQKGNVAAIMVVDSAATIKFKGTNNIYGSATGSDNAIDYYVNYVPGMPVGASHGIYTSNNTAINVSGTTKCIGADGGAGICVSGKLNITSAVRGKLIANGSGSSTKNMSYFPMAVGAGIGGSISTSIQKVTKTVSSSSSSTTTTTYYEKRSGGSVNYVGANAQIVIVSLSIEASGANISNINANNKSGSNITLYSDDIGGVNVAGTKYGVNTGSITETTVVNANQRIDTSIATQNKSNDFKPEVYTISVYTHGKEGITKKGVKFKLHGETRDSAWINAADCGNVKGDWSGTFVVNSVGKINYIEVKTNDSNTWFPGKITVTAKLGGESLTVYGGRWIGTDAVSLKTNDRIYKVTIKTGSVDDSGTNSDIFLRLRDTNGNESDPYQLDSIHHANDAFEKNDVATFWLYANGFTGKCDGVFLASDHSGRGPDWKVDSISVENVSDGNDKFTISAGYWFRIEQTVYFGRRSQYTGAYYIEVKTSDVKKAGTDSNIYLTVFGTNGNNSGEIDLGEMAEDGDNFERGDMDAMCIGYNVTALGDIKSLKIRKDNDGSGPDWHLEYIIIKEIVADGETAKSYKFTWKNWIEDETVILTSRSAINNVRNTVRLDRSVLSKLTVNKDGTYTLPVDREITLSEEVFDLLAEKSAVLNVTMESDDKVLYEVIFDGSAFDSAKPVTLNKNYSFADGKTLFDFLQDLDLPEKTKIRLHAENIGFLGTGRYSVFAKGDDGSWQKLENVIDSDGIIEFYAQKAKELMLVDKQNAWTVTPNVESWVYGEQTSDAEGEALYGDYTVRYTGTADDGTSYDSFVAPEKAGKYTAVFTVEATDTYDGLTYEVEFDVTTPSDDTTEDESTTVPDESTTVPDESTTTPDESTTEPGEVTTDAGETTADKSKDTTTDVSDAAKTKESSLTWLWITITAVIAFAAGATVCGIVLRKKEK